MKKGQILSLNEALTSLQEKGTIKFKYAVIKNLKKIAGEVETLAKLVDDINESRKAFFEAKEVMLKPYFTKGRTEIKETDKDYLQIVAKIEKLQEKHKADFDTYDGLMKQYKEILNSENETDFNFHCLEFSELPADISGKELTQLLDWKISKEPEDEEVA